MKTLVTVAKLHPAKEGEHPAAERARRAALRGSDWGTRLVVEAKEGGRRPPALDDTDRPRPRLEAAARQYLSQRERDAG